MIRRLTTRGDGPSAVSAVVVGAILLGLLLTTGIGRAWPIETDTFSLTPSPLVVNGFERRSFAMDPGEGDRVTDAVRVANSTEEPRRFRLYGADARRDPETEAVLVDAATVEPKGVGTWVEFETTEIEVPPGAWEVVPFTVTRPPGTTTEGLGAIVAEEIIDEAETGGVDLVYRLAILIRLDGNATGLRVGVPSMSPATELFPSRSDVSVAVTNETLAPARATVRFTSGGLTGRFWEVGAAEVRLDPGESADVTATWETVPRWGGWFEPTAEVVWEQGSIVRTGSRTLHAPLWLVALAILLVAVRAIRELRLHDATPGGS